MARRTRWSNGLSVNFLSGKQDLAQAFDSLKVLDCAPRAPRLRGNVILCYPCEQVVA